MPPTSRNEFFLTGEYRLTAGIESLCITRTFTRISNLARDATIIFDSLNANDFSGNQWILIPGLTQKAIDRLDSEKDCLNGVSFRFEWDGARGLIKVMPGAGHEMPTNDFTLVVFGALRAMGLYWEDIRWGGATRYRSHVGNKGKEGDQIFLPRHRQPVQGQIQDWPTLVIETGVSESLPKLQEDAKWWFNNSSGRIRIVILISLKRTKMLFQKWQLVPPNAPTPITRQYISSLRQQSPNMPPSVNQPATIQTLYMDQEVTVTPNAVIGAPMVLPFQALMDRAPAFNETDISITAQHFRGFARTWL
ncbi:hypothetical protein BDV27DRAFT_160897 [Aspergillus caelatus]|uniref:Uncharacterized protein n=1 Tax=Aspergillus caelatus TaxID=61420 RepID=A0A5N6ZUZ2_9EURO|nr:uncharacterized protein BDV27DRAFT_160897 [Aspergillus caelatus]KAE8361225.1 hypothetical protein BDV27DRAFT_160897 [Aspergillus caelatus]